MPGMFDPQPGQTEVQDEQQQTMSPQDGPTSTASPLGDNLDQFNQHILLCSQAVSRVRQLLQVRCS